MNSTALPTSMTPGAFVGPLTGRVVHARVVLGHSNNGAPIYAVAGGSGEGGGGDAGGGDAGGGDGGGDSGGGGFYRDTGGADPDLYGGRDEGDRDEGRAARRGRDKSEQVRSTTGRGGRIETRGGTDDGDGDGDGGDDDRYGGRPIRDAIDDDDIDDDDDDDFDGDDGDGPDGDDDDDRQARDGDDDGDWDMDDLPKGARNLIKKLRAESGKNRAEARDAKKAAEASGQQLTGAVEALMNALGLTPDDKPAKKLTAAELGEQLAEKNKAHEDTTQKLRGTEVSLAVYRAAGKVGGDPDALLDSNSFMKSVAGLDPSDRAFGTELSIAIREAVSNNPKLRAAQAAEPVASGGEFAGGPRDRHAAENWSVDDFRAQRARERERARAGSTY